MVTNWRMRIGRLEAQLKGDGWEVSSSAVRAAGVKRAKEAVRRLQEAGIIDAKRRRIRQDLRPRRTGSRLRVSGLGVAYFNADHQAAKHNGAPKTGFQNEIRRAMNREYEGLTFEQARLAKSDGFRWKW